MKRSVVACLVAVVLAGEVFADLSITPTEATFGPEGGYGTISTFGDGKWTASVDYATGYNKLLKSWWAHVTPSSNGNVGYPICYLVDENLSVLERETYINVYPGPIQHKIWQSGCAMTLSCTNLEFRAKGGVVQVDIAVRVGVPLDIRADQDWISVEVDESSEVRILNVRVARFEHAYTWRSGKIVVGNQEIFIKQWGPTVNTSPRAVYCSAEGGMVSFVVDPEERFPRGTDLCVWSMVTTNDWIEIQGDDIRMFGSLASAFIKGNQTGIERVGVIKIQRANTNQRFDGDFEEVLLIQPPCKASGSLSVTPQFVSVSSEKQEFSLDVATSAGVAWSALTSDDWMSLGMGDGVGSQMLGCHIAGNTDVWSRTGAVAIHSVFESAVPELDLTAGLEVEVSEEANVEGNDGRGMTHSLQREYDGTFFNSMTGTPFRITSTPEFSCSFSFSVGAFGKFNPLASFGSVFGLCLNTENRLCIYSQTNTMIAADWSATDFIAHWTNVTYTVLLRQDANGVVSVFAAQKNDHLSKVGVLPCISILPFDKKHVEATSIVLGKTQDAKLGCLQDGLISDLRIWLRALNDRECEYIDVIRGSVYDMRPRGVPEGVAIHYFPMDGNMVGALNGCYFCKDCKKLTDPKQNKYLDISRFGVSNHAVRAEHCYVFSRFSELFDGQSVINGDREWPDGGICASPERRYVASSAGGTGSGWGYFCKHGYNSDDYFPHPAVAYGDCETDATYSLWVRVDSFPSEDQGGVPILERTRPTCDARGVVVDAENGRIRLTLLPTGKLRLSGSGISEVTSSQKLTGGLWSQIMIVGRSKDSVSLFVNGKKWLEVPSTMTLGYLAPVDRRCYCYGSDTPEHGEIEYAALSVGGWVGAVDDISFYHVSLTDDQVLEAYLKNESVGGQVIVDQGGAPVAIDPQGVSIDAAGGTRTLTVTTGASTQWTTYTDATWVTVENGAVSTGGCDVVVSIAPNASAADRTAVLTIAGSDVLIVQEGHGANLSVESLSFDAGSSGKAITVTAEPGTTWTATSDSSWLVVSVGASGTGTGPVVVVTERNYANSARTAILTIAGQQVVVTQQPDSVVVEPRTFLCDYSASTLRSSVSAPESVNWSATSGVDWLSLSAGANGRGDGSIEITVAKNTSGADRVGLVSINGVIPIVVTQLVTRALSGVSIIGQGHVTGSLPYKTGETQMLKAVPGSGYVFDHWVYNGKSNSGVTLSVSSDDYQSLTAIFVRQGIESFSSSNAFYSCNMTWKPRVWATSYKIYRSTTVQLPEQAIEVLAAGAAAFSDTNGVSGTTYYYWIEAVAKDGSSSFTGPITGLRKHIRTDELDIDGPSVVCAGEQWKFMGGCVWTDGMTITWGNDNYTSVSWSITPLDAQGITFYKTSPGWYSMFEVSEGAPEQTCIVKFAGTGSAASSLGVRSVEKRIHVLPVRKVNGPGTVSFDMRMEQAEGYQGYFQVLKDGVVVGTVGSDIFEKLSFDVLDAESHVFSWRSVPWPGHTGGRINSSHGVMTNYVWTAAPASVDVTFNPNGGSCSLSSKLFTPGQKIGELPVPSREGCMFKCWSTSQSESDAVTALTYVPLRDTILYAIWDVRHFDVIFELGDHAHRIGGGLLKQSVEYGSSAVPPDVIVDDGYVSKGWSCSFDRISADLTIYLNVAKKSCVVQFDANGGTGSMADLSLSNDLAVAIASNAFVRSGYAFAGWSDAEIGNVILHEGDVVSNMTFAADDVRLYAQWSAIPYSISYLNVKGANNNNPLVYTIEDSVAFCSLENVNDFEFAGWTPATIASGSTGDKVVTADWNWAPSDATVEATITGGKPLSIKADWAKTELNQRFGAGKSKVFCEKFGGDFAAALTQKTGKRDGANNELSVWHDYVAGTDPTDSNSVFKATMKMVNGFPVVEWDPNLNSNGEERVYTIYGKNALGDAWHSPTNANDHFFKVDVAMPSEGMVTFNLGGATGSVDPVSVRVGQPVGDLPTPTRDGYEFLGWFTLAEGGEMVTPETIVTADLTIFAHWKSVRSLKSKTISGYLSGSNTLLLEGVKISDVTNMTALVGGAHVNNKTPLQAKTYHIVRTAQTIDVQFQVLDGTYVKCVGVTLSQVGNDIYGKVAYSGRYKSGASNLGYDFTKSGYSTWNNGDIATSETTSGYGVKNLTLEYWQ